MCLIYLKQVGPGKLKNLENCTWVGNGRFVGGQGHDMGGNEGFEISSKYRHGLNVVATVKSDEY